MPNRSKNKGDKEERAIVNLHREWGFNATRTLKSGARSDGSKTFDIEIYNVKNFPFLHGEAKVRADGFKQIYDYLGSNHFLTIRADNKERLYVIPEEIWRKLIS